MKNSQFEYLKNPNTIVIAAGHGGGDPGAVNNNAVEADQTITITNELVRLLRNKNIVVDLVPHDYGLLDAIQYVNSNYGWDEAWAIEIHRDSATGVNQVEADRRCGVFGYGAFNNNSEDSDSMDIARFMRDVFVSEGASTNSYASTDDQVRFGRLGWIRDVVPTSHLIELGFVQGNASIDHLHQLAAWTAAAIYEAFTGQKYEQATPPTPTPPASSGTWYIKSAKQTQNNIKLWNNKYITSAIKEAVISKPNFELLLTTIIKASSERDAGMQNKAMVTSTPAVSTAHTIESEQPVKLVDNLGQNINMTDWGPNKNFFTSKKVWITLLSNLLSFGVVILQTAQLDPNDDWRNILIKLASAALAALGISTVANQYVKVQGAIDQSTVDTVKELSALQNSQSTA